MNEKVVWITGASSGIGESMARKLAAKGSLLVLSARRKEELERVKRECAVEEGRILVLPLDIAETDKHAKAVERVMAAFGRIDIMIHNAGISNRSFIRDSDLPIFRRIMEVNFFGTISLTKAVLPVMRKQKEGHFVVISSLMGKFSSPGRAAYTSSKHALEGFFNALRMEHYQDHIAVTIVSPGFVQTNVTKNSLTADGSPQGAIDKTTASGVPVDVAARKILRAIEKRKQDIVFGGIEVLGVYLKRFAPGILTRMVLANRKKWEIGNTVK